MKKISILHFLPAAILLVSCSGLDKGLLKSMFKVPTVSVEKTELKGLDFDKVSLLVHLTIQNENPFGVTFRGIDYGLFVDRNENPLLSSSVRETISIAAEQDNPVSFPVDLHYKEITNLDFSKAEIVLGLKGHVLLQTIAGNLRLPFELEKPVPVPRLPEFSLTSLKLIDLDLIQKTASVQLALGVYNPNSFPLPLGSFSFNLALDGVEVSSENELEDFTVAPNATGQIPLYIDLDLAEIKTALESIMKGSPVNFELEGSYGLDGPDGPQRVFPFKVAEKKIITS
jgi:LEA14-like dessication related protein